jgi:tetratricopeptide (TPR) repeat protein
MDALRQNPQQAGQSLCQNGFASLSRGQFATAERQFRASLDYVPDHPIATAGLGIARFELGAADEGIALLQRAADAAPREAFIAHVLGESLCRILRFGEAVPHLERAIAINPAFVEAHNALGNALSAMGARDPAMAHYTMAARLNPALPEPHNNLGLAYAAQGRHEEAVAAYRAAIRARGDYTDAWLNLGLSLLELKRASEALAAFGALGRNGRAVLGRGMALQALGRVDEARAAFAEAVRLLPDYPPAYMAFGDGRKFQPGDPAIAAMEALRPRAIPPSEQAALHFALFKAYDDTARHSDAFSALTEANRTWRTQEHYDEAAELGALTAIAETFTRESLTPVGEASDLPVFVVGMPRSGTSLVEQILASHPSVHGAGELGDLGLLSVGSYAPGKAALTRLLADPAALAAAGARYREHLKTLAPNAQRVVDKMPANFMFIGLIRKALPGARIIHVRRNALDTCFSCYAHQFQGNLAYTYDLGELGRYYCAYENLMAHWRAVLPADAMLELDYETLVGDFETEARRLIAYCGLPWDESCTAFHKKQRPVHTASAFQVRMPLYTTSVGRAAPYMEHLGELIAALKP